jgi:hypothetical protein
MGVIQVQHRYDGSSSTDDAGDAITETEYHFPNGQVEKHYQDGSKVVMFADGNLQNCDASDVPITESLSKSSSPSLSRPKPAAANAVLE